MQSFPPFISPPHTTINTTFATPHVTHVTRNTYTVHKNLLIFL